MIILPFVGLFSGFMFIYIHFYIFFIFMFLQQPVEHHTVTPEGGWQLLSPAGRVQIQRINATVRARPPDFPFHPFTAAGGPTHRYASTRSPGGQRTVSTIA